MLNSINYGRSKWSMIVVFVLSLDTSWCSNLIINCVTSCRYDTSGIGVVRAEHLLKKLGIEFRESKTPSNSMLASLNGAGENMRRNMSVDSTRKFDPAGSLINVRCEWALFGHKEEYQMTRFRERTRLKQRWARNFIWSRHVTNAFKPFKKCLKKFL